MRRIMLYLPVIFLISCKNPVTPENKLTPGRRDYTWTVDTIKIPFNFLSRITGSGPDDVYAVGSGGGLDETIWHYDGIKWKTDGVSRGISPLCIYSFSKVNVWTAGFEGKIWHYDGTQWAMKLDFKKANYTVGFVDIWGDSPQNIYATGYADSSDIRKAIIVHYNGTNWEEEKIPFFPYDFLRIKKDINGNGKYYILGYAIPPEGTVTGLFEYDGVNKVNKLYEKPFDINTAPYFQLFGNKLYLLIGKTLNTYENSQLVPLLKITKENFVGQMWGRRINDVFLLMNDGIAHYNGTDIQYVFRDNNASISDAVIFDKEIFFVAADFANNQSLMIKGVLK